jgi:hypothetical protein
MRSKPSPRPAWNSLALDLYLSRALVPITCLLLGGVAPSSRVFGPRSACSSRAHARMGGKFPIERFRRGRFVASGYTLRSYDG